MRPRQSPAGGSFLRPALLLVLAALLAAPTTLAQAHEHGIGENGLAFVLRDGPEGGRAVVGGLTHFGFALLDAEGKPVVHQDASFRVEQEGVVLFESEDTHEYDGLFGFDLTFHRPGPYVVTAASGDMEQGVFAGEAVLPVNETVARLDAQARRVSDGLVEATVSVVDADGALVPHTDVIAEVRRDADLRLVSRVHLHVHDEPIVLTHALGPEPTTMHLVGYRAFPSGRSPDVRAVVASLPLGAGVAPAPALPAPALPADPLEPRGATATAGGFTLHAMVDPQPLVGAGNPFRLAALVTNASGLPQQHVDFAFELRGPAGVVFASRTLHEYDGVFELAHVADLPGVYDGALTAETGEGPLSVPFRVHVAPPVAPLDAGVKTVRVDGLDALVAGEPAEVTFTIAGPEGPLRHSEVDVTVLREGEAPLYQFKLHTHGSGSTSALLTFPSEGDWIVVVDPAPLLPQAVVVVGPEGPGAPIRFAAQVAPGVAAVEDVLPLDADAAQVPGAGALAGLAVAAAALARRRR